MRLSTVILFVLLSFGIASGQKQGEQKVQIDAAKKEKLLQIGIMCVGETGVDLSVLTQIASRKYKDDENVKKFIFCGFRKAGIASKSGQVRAERMLDIYPDTVDKDALKKVIQECNSEAKEPTDKIYNFFKCFQHKTPFQVELMR